MDREKQMDKMAKDLCHLQTCEAKKDGTNCYKYCKAYIYAFRACNAGYRKQIEAAREIFDEIENNKRFIQDHAGNIGIVVTLQDITELKKKYTEQN